MRRRIELIALLLAMGPAAAQAQMQNQVPMQGPSPHGATTPSDMSRTQQSMVDAMASAKPLKITFGQKSAEWTPATLAVLPHKTLTVYNEHSKANETYSGVPLIDLLKPLGVPDKPRGKDFKIFLVAIGSDDYQVVYSLGEVTPDVHDGTVLVADTEDGKPIATDGPLKMVATGEKRPARWVRNLVGIHVLMAP
jgi:hypothetical protein